MKKQPLKLNAFKAQKLNDKQTLQIKGGHTKIRRQTGTTTPAIWDEVEIRIGKVEREIDTTVIFTPFGG